VTALEKAAGAGGLADARDVAAVLDWRLDDTGLRSTGRGPLPWLPAVPAALRDDPTWGEYFITRADLVHDLAQHVRYQARAEEAAIGEPDRNVAPGRGERSPQPTWLDAGGRRPPGDVVAEVQVWRAAMQVAPADRRPTGGPQLQKAAHTWQRALDARVQGDRTPALSEWGHLLHRLSPALRHDPFTPVLADRLAGLSRAGVDARTQLTRAVTTGPLPDDHAAAALWWRISPHISPAVTTGFTTLNAHATPLPAAWTTHLQQVLGDDRAQAVMASPWWPALVTVIDHGLRRGWQPQDLLAAAAPPLLTTPLAADTTPRPLATRPANDSGVADGGDGDVCLAMVWRASVLTDPAPDPDSGLDRDVLEDPPPPDLWDGVAPVSGHLVVTEPAPTPATSHATEDADTLHLDVHLDANQAANLDSQDTVVADLAVQARLRRVLGAPEPSAMETERALQRAFDIETSPVTPERVVDINQLALAYFQQAFPGSWAQTYLQHRFDRDLTGHPSVRPGYAPAAWTGIVQHLRHADVSDEEMLAAGVATTASTGRLIDRFRDRAILPLIHHGRVLAFVGRRHPDLTDSGLIDAADRHQSGPKYLNTATTVAYSKSAQLYVADPTLLEQRAIPVLVEGPMDAIAVTLAGTGRHVGVAPLGTALSDQQATQLAHHHDRFRMEPVVATDADLAGRLAAERAYWTLTLHGMDPTLATLPPGTDPAELYATEGPATLQRTLEEACPLGDALVEERLVHLPPRQAVTAALAVVAARPPQHWKASAHTLTQRTGRPRPEVDQQLLACARAWSADPRRATEAKVQDLRSVRERLQKAANRGDQPGPRSAAQRWHSVAQAIDSRLVNQDDWPALAEVMDRLEGLHLDVATAARELIRTTPLGADAARDLRYRLLETAPPDDAHDTPRAVPHTPVPAASPQRREVTAGDRGDRAAVRPR